MNKLVSSLFALFLFSTPLSAETGYIQIKAPPGIMIFLDGNLKGKTTSEQGGLVLQDVPAGTREIKALKAGSNTKTYRINVKAGDIAVWDAGVFAPKIIVEESGVTEKGGYQPIGFLQIKSVPVDMKISIPSIGLNYSKTKPDVKFSKIPAGEYLVNFSGFGKNLSSKITIYDKVTTEVFLNLLKGEIQNKTEEDAKVKAKNIGWADYRIIMSAIDLRRTGNNYTGWAKRSHDNGQVKELAQYKNGKQHGVSTEWYENGQKRMERNYKEGNKDGLTTTWYENGQKETEVNYKDGKQDGLWVFYKDEDGEEYARETYKNGVKSN